MKIIIMIIIGGLTGLISGMFGLYVWEQPLTYLVINVPIILICSVLLELIFD